MHTARVLDQLTDEQYARIESVILDLQLSISSVRRANSCLDLPTVRNIRGRAAETLAQVEHRVASLRTEPWQTRRLSERQRTLSLLLQEPAPIEHLARSLHVG